jgi:hypothetical protein
MRVIRCGAILLVALLGLSVASARDEDRDSLPRGGTGLIRFEPGSAVLPEAQRDRFGTARESGMHFSSMYNFLVRGYADSGTSKDPKSWKPEDLALADARARAMSEYLRTLGGPECVDRVAYGYALEEPPPDKYDHEPRVGVPGGELVLSRPDQHNVPPKDPRTVTDCGTVAPPQFRDGLAKQYLAIALGIGVVDPSYVDAYYGPKELQDQAVQQVEAYEGKVRLQDLSARASNLDQDLQALVNMDARQPPADAMDALRARFIHEQIVAAYARLEVLQGRKLSFDEEAKRIYDAEPPHYDRAHFEAIHRQIDALLPGPGTTAERVNAFRDRFIIPKKKLERVFKAAIAGCRAQTLKHIALRAGESFDLEFVTNKPWGGYNWYKGNYHSLIQINVELPIYIDRALDIGCHEGYPGHHVYNMLLEQHLVNERHWQEFSVYPLFSPQSLIAEGSANYGIEMAFPPAERLKFEREVLYPAAGLDRKQAGKYEALTALIGQLAYADNEAARGYLDGKMTRDQAIAWLVEVGLVPPPKAAQRIDFFDKLRSYVVNYNVGKDLVKDYVERQGQDEATRWKAFEELLSSPRVPSDLGTPGVRDESAGEAFSAAELRRCAQLHGEIEAVGFDASTCVYPSHDAGKSCRDSSECEGRCDAPEPATRGQAVTGTCSARVGRAGCANVVKNGIASGRICSD